MSLKLQNVIVLQYKRGYYIIIVGVQCKNRKNNIYLQFFI